MFSFFKKKLTSFVFIYSLTFVFLGIFLVTNSSIELLFYNNDHISKQDTLEKVSSISLFNSSRNIPKTYPSINNFKTSLKKDDKILNEYILNELPKNLNLIKDVKRKKEIFIKTLLPIIYNENKKILAQRLRILSIQQSLDSQNTLSKENQIFIEKMANYYNIKTTDRLKVDVINELTIKVDIIPNSIVLAQAANESGWGSSRFARDFNALFGQYTYDENKGIKPSFRDKNEKHLIKFFPNIHESVRSYLLNINTNVAYYDFRKLRNSLRQDLNKLTYEPLIKTLDNYAEDKNYIKTLKSIIRVNQLYKFDTEDNLLTKS